MADIFITGSSEGNAKPQGQKREIEKKIRSKIEKQGKREAEKTRKKRKKEGSKPQKSVSLLTNIYVTGQIRGKAKTGGV